MRSRRHERCLLLHPDRSWPGMHTATWPACPATPVGPPPRTCACTRRMSSSSCITLKRSLSSCTRWCTSRYSYTCAKSSRGKRVGLERTEAWCPSCLQRARAKLMPSHVAHCAAAAAPAAVARHSRVPLNTLSPCRLLMEKNNAYRLVQAADVVGRRGDAVRHIQHAAKQVHSRHVPKQRAHVLRRQRRRRGAGQRESVGRGTGACAARRCSRSAADMWPSSAPTCFPAETVTNMQCLSPDGVAALQCRAGSRHWVQATHVKPSAGTRQHSRTRVAGLERPT